MGPTLAKRDIILIDQRGTGFSKPALTCSLGAMTLDGRLPIGMKQADDRPAAIQLQLAMLKACGESYRAAGIDLRAYNSVENAADLEDLRRALGLGTWNIYGGSYGSRLALTAMQYRPETLRSVAIESIYPLQANFHVDVFTSFEQTLNRLFADCAADPACSAANPNLAERYDQMIPRLNANPAQVPLIDLETEQLITYIPISGVDTVTIIFQFSYITQIIPIMPLLITETANGNYRLLSILLSALLTQPVQPGQGISLGMQIAVQCNEDVVFASARDFVAARDSHRRAAPLAHNLVFNEAILEVCAAWGLMNPDPADNWPARSDVPALLINGTYDPITPPQFATSAAETLSRSQVVMYPRGGHSPSPSSACLGNMIAMFYDNPAMRPDESCIARETPLPFITP
jgi:pimeloyl-ACP methyl ester carboxylesterase